MRSLLLIAVACLLTACAQQSHVQLYPGNPLPKNQVLTVIVPYELEVQSLNGQNVPKANAMFGTTDKTLHLQPGEYRISAFYKNVFDVDGGLSHEVVRSRMAVYSIDGKAGEVWRLGFDKPANLREARELQDEFNSWAVNTATGERVVAERGQRNSSLIGSLMGGRVIEEHSVVEPLSSVAPVAPSSANAIRQPAPHAEAALSHNDAVLGTLQQLWQLLDEEGRAAFLAWTAQ